PPDAILVHDMPLIVEQQMIGEYHLVVVVGVAEGPRLRRLVEHRGMTAADARARIAAQADDAARRDAADVWLDNEGTSEELEASVARLWHERVEPFEANLRGGIRSRMSAPVLSPSDPTWPGQAARLLARVRHAVGDAAVTLHHIGSTAVPGLLAKDVIDLQIGVRQLTDADQPAFVSALAAAGFARPEGEWADRSKDGTPWPKRFHGSADPGRVAHLHVREVGSPGWRWALQFRDWLRDDRDERDRYAAAKTTLAAVASSTEHYAEAKEPWFDQAWERSHGWAQRVGWRAPTA
ncbi:MAG: dephospho-CoA kinase, partial [Dermatophilaceae bacterium]